MRYLVIVARDQLDVFEHLKLRLAGDPKVDVMFDRRRGERRRRMEGREDERRLGDRRRVTSARARSFQPVSIARAGGGRAFLQEAPSFVAPAPPTLRPLAPAPSPPGPRPEALPREPRAAQELVRWGKAAPALLRDLSAAVGRERALVARWREVGTRRERLLDELVVVSREHERLIAERLELGQAFTTLLGGSGDRVDNTISVLRTLDRSHMIPDEPQAIDFGRSFLLGRLKQTSEAMVRTIQEARRKLAAMQPSRSPRERPPERPADEPHDESNASQ